MQNKICFIRSRSALIVLIMIGLCMQGAPSGSETLLDRKLSLDVSGKSMDETCQILREQDHIPICFIDQTRITPHYAKA